MNIIKKISRILKKEDKTRIKNNSLRTEVMNKRNISQLKKRVDEIEKKLHKGTTIEKVAFVDYAILATKLEAFSEDVNRIEKSMLTKWDVAKIVLEIIIVLCILMDYFIGK